MISTQLKAFNHRWPLASPSRWIRDQQKSEGITPGEDVYIILRLDGRVRKSGRVSDPFLIIIVKQ